MAVGAHVFPEMFPVNGLQLGVVEAGVKYENRKDLVLFAAESGARVAGVFTLNAFCAAPVHIAKAHLKQLPC